MQPPAGLRILTPTPTLNPCPRGRAPGSTPCTQTGAGPPAAAPAPAGETAPHPAGRQRREQAVRAWPLAARWRPHSYAARSSAGSRDLPAQQILQPQQRVGGPALTCMMDVLLMMYTCSMAMVGTSAIMMRRSELAIWCRQGGGPGELRSGGAPPCPFPRQGLYCRLPAQPRHKLLCISQTSPLARCN